MITLTHPPYTVQLFESMDYGKDVFVEFIDVGGAREFVQSRSMFYTDVHGICVVLWRGQYGTLNMAVCYFEKGCVVF